MNKNTREFPELFWHPARRCNIDPSVYMPAAAPALSTLTSSYDEMNMSLQRAPRTGLDEANRHGHVIGTDCLHGSRGWAGKWVAGRRTESWAQLSFGFDRASAHAPKPFLCPTLATLR